MDNFDRLDKAFENKVRIGIMSVLCVNSSISHTELKATLGLTDGNLASHITNLQKRGFVEVKKQFLGKKPNTTYQATDQGRTAFTTHLDALEKILKNIK